MKCKRIDEAAVSPIAKRSLEIPKRSRAWPLAVGGVALLLAFLTVQAGCEQGAPPIGSGGKPGSSQTGKGKVTTPVTHVFDASAEDPSDVRKEDSPDASPPDMHAGMPSRDAGPDAFVFVDPIFYEHWFFEDDDGSVVKETARREDHGIVHLGQSLDTPVVNGRFIADGAQGRALRVGAEYGWVKLPNSAFLSSPPAGACFGVRAWVRLRSFGTSEWNGIWTKGQTGDSGWHDFLGLHRGHLAFGLGTELIEAKDELPLNKWHNVAAIFDGITMSLYLNNQAVGSLDIDAFDNPTKEQFILGAIQRGTTVTDYLEGDLDQVTFNAGCGGPDSF